MIRKLFLCTFILLLTSSVMCAQLTVTGTVSDSSGPLPGASVLVKGTNSGTTTDFDGNYSITVPNNEATLVFAFLGFLDKEIIVGTQTTINVTLEEDSQSLDEVVVTALGFVENRDEQGSTSSLVKAETIIRSGEATITNALSGKASGVKISRSNGDPGAGSTIRIRGANSILGASDPLIIVDGVPLNNTTSYGGGNNLTGGRSGGISQGSRFNDINPADVASIEILKGASAAAIWGSRAANGVIVIVTKKGKSGKAKITYSSSYSFDKVSERIPMQNTWGQGRSGVFGVTRAESWGDYIPDRAGGLDDFDTSGEFFTANDGTVYFPITGKNSTDTFVDDNWDSTFQTGNFWQNDITISGGSDNNTYFFSLANIKQEGIIRESSYDRTNVRLNYNSKLNNLLSFSAKTSYTYTNSNRIQQSSNTAGVMLGLLRTSPDFDQRDYIGTYTNNSGEEFIRRQRSYRRYLGSSVNPAYNNALWTVYEQKAPTVVNRFTVTPELIIKPTNWLQIITRANADVSDDRRQYFFPVGSAGSVRNIGAYQEDAISTRDVNFDLIGRANFVLTEKIDLTATAGYSVNDRKFNRISGLINGFLVNSTKPTTALNTAVEASTFDGFRTHRRSNRGYGILNFDVDDKLFVTFSGGLEASSTVKGTFFYPAVDAAWEFTKKEVAPGNVLSFGKLRASWGQVGVQPSPHRFETLAEGGFSYTTYSDEITIDAFGGGFRLDNNLGNPDLKPEIKTEWEIGADLRFFDDDLSFGFTYYQNEIKDILLDVSLSPSSGFATQYGNFGAMENKGFEFDIGWKIIKKEDLQLSTSLNWSTNENLVTDLFGTETVNLSPGASVSSRAVVGYPLGVLFGTGSQTNADGSYILDANGFPQITPSPIVLGDPNPDWRAGVGINLTYRKFNVNIVMEHSQGGSFSPRTLWVLRRFGTTQETANRTTLTEPLVNYAGNTIPSGTVVRGRVADFGGGQVLLDESWYRTGIGGGFGDNQAYNLSLFDATFTKVREMSLSYNLDIPWLNESTGLNSVIFTVTGRNLINVNKIPGIDPEVNQYGVGNALGLDYFTNPQTESVLFKVSFNF